MHSHAHHPPQIYRKTTPCLRFPKTIPRPRQTRSSFGNSRLAAEKTGCEAIPLDITSLESVKDAGIIDTDELAPHQMIHVMPRNLPSVLKEEGNQCQM